MKKVKRKSTVYGAKGTRAGEGVKITAKMIFAAPIYFGIVMIFASFAIFNWLAEKVCEGCEEWDDRLL